MVVGTSCHPPKYAGLFNNMKTERQQQWPWSINARQDGKKITETKRTLRKLVICLT